MRIYLLGQICKDEILSKRFEGVKRSIGGGVFYSALTLKFLGLNPTVLTKLNPKDQKILKPFKDLSIKCHWWESHKTTIFRNEYDYNFESREQYLLGDADSINIRDIKGIIGKSSVILASPLTSNFIPVHVLKYFSKNDFITTLGLQGYLRDASKRRIRLIKPKNIKDVLVNCSMVSLNKVEAEQIGPVENPMKAAEWISKQGPEEVIITNGSNGGIYYSNNERFTYVVPRSKISQKETTGAGDIFMSCYLFSKLKDMPPRKSIEFAVDTTYNLLEMRNEIFAV